MAYIDKLIGKFNKIKGAVDSFKGIQSKLQNINYNTAIDALGEEKEKAIKDILSRNKELDKLTSNKTKRAIKKTPSNTTIEFTYPYHDDLHNYIVFETRSRHTGTEGTDPEGRKAVALYVPDTLISQASVSYGGTDMSRMGAALMQIASAIASPQADLGLATRSAAATIVPTMIQQGLNKMSGGQENLKKGIAINPLKEQLLQGLDFRTWDFTFEFFPRSQDEATQVQNIIHTFRTAMLPGTADSTSVEGVGEAVGDVLKANSVTADYFTYPNVFDIYFDGPLGSAIDGFLPAVCTNAQVDHTGGLKFSTYENGMPVKTTLTLQFQEIKMLTQSNYREISAIENNSFENETKRLGEDTNLNKYTEPKSTSDKQDSGTTSNKGRGPSF